MADATRNIIHTRRLILRELDGADLDAVAELLGDPEVMRYWPRPYTREESAEWIERQKRRYADDGCGYWLAVERSDGDAIGQVGVMMIPIEGVREPALGWIIARRRWRRGYAFEAASACVDYTFRTLHHHRAVALVRPENLASARLARKLHMTHSGTTMHAGMEHLIFAKSSADPAASVQSATDAGAGVNEKGQS